MTLNEEGELYMPQYGKIRIQAKAPKKPKIIHKIDQAESSFIMHPAARADVAKVQSALLSYSDDAEEQVRRAQARLAPYESYDLKLVQEILRSVLGFGAKIWDEDAFRNYTESLMSYYEFKTQSRHTDISRMASELSDFERAKAHASFDHSFAHENLSEVWKLI
jgi:hypothetical protein